MKIGLALSGGGIKGVAHVGVLKALSEFNIQPTQISGTSVGAIVGAMHAGGHTWEAIYDFFKNAAIFSVKRYARGKPGIFDSLKFEEELSIYFPEDTFEALKIPLSVTATTVLSGKQHTFNRGALIRPIIASACFPGVFTPIEIAGDYYFDGGVIDDFPVEPLIASCDQIIGSYVNPLSAITMTDLKHSYQVLNRAYEINLYHNGQNKFNDCDLLVCPSKLAKYGTFSMRSIDEIFYIGYEAACIQLEKSVKLK